MSERKHQVRRPSHFQERNKKWRREKGKGIWRIWMHNELERKKKKKATPFTLLMPSLFIFPFLFSTVQKKLKYTRISNKLHNNLFFRKNCQKPHFSVKLKPLMLSFDSHFEKSLQNSTSKFIKQIMS